MRVGTRVGAGWSPRAGRRPSRTHQGPWSPCFSALKRKGKGGDVTEADMDSVVAAHNGEGEKGEGGGQAGGAGLGRAGRQSGRPASPQPL